MNFFAELSRRKVFKVAAAYIIVSWLIMQAGDTLAPALQLPEWVNSLLVFFLILGFPLAMIFTWAFEMTPDGLKKEKDINTSQAITELSDVESSRSSAHSEDTRMEKHPASAGRDDSAEMLQGPLLDGKSIAVIPFSNRSANEENAEFFADGIHDELLTNLSKIKALKVISRTSVMGYRDTTKNLRQIGKELGVANILEGGVQRAGDSVRINVQLIDATTDEHLWAKVYDRNLTVENLFAIQSEISQSIANVLVATLSPREQLRLATVPTTNLEAYDNLLLARQLLDRGNWEGMREAQDFLQKTIEMDPGFVEAHLLLAWSYYLLVVTGESTLSALDASWIQTIQTALLLDKNRALVYALLAQYQWQKGLDGVDENFKKARQMEPDNIELLTMYAEYLRYTFHPDRALPLYQLARQLDPRSITVLYGLARIYETRRELDKSLEMYARIRQVDPDSQVGKGPLTTVYLFSGDMVHSGQWLFKSLVDDPDDSDLKNWGVLALIDFGDLNKARQWLSLIEDTKSDNPMTFAGLATLSIYSGDIKASIAFSRQALLMNMPTRWGSDARLVKALLIWALDQKQAATALGILQANHPELFELNPVLDANNVLQAIDAAHLLQLEDQSNKADVLLHAVISAYEIPYKITELQHATGKAQALALLGEKQAALIELRQQMDQGWRFSWRWNSELNPNFKSLHNDPEFREMVEFLRMDAARQYEQFRAMQAAGEIPMPLEKQTL